MPSSPEPHSVTAKPKIKPVPNGPLYLINSDRPQQIENLQNSKGEPISKVVSVALCRCGGSKSKPFCDGTHGPSHFSSENTSPPSVPDKRKDYSGKSITVHDNRRVCSHSAECLRNLESVFNLEQRPWINPDQSTMESVINTVKKCPSGALSYSIDGVEHRDQSERKPTVIVDKNGPYRVEGGIELIGVENWAVGASKEHFALCRCGASNNKPFCDGTHLSIRFRDE
jgi:CDGSH-type Zn-finger protein